MSAPRQKKRSSVLVDVILIGVFLVGLALVVVATREIINDRTLAQGEVPVEARVTETRKVISRKAGESYQVRYAFQVGTQTYSYKDETGRTDLWSTISQDAWVIARRTGVIEVTYLPTDPWVNHAVARSSDGLFGNIAGLIVGLLCMVPGLLWAVSAIRRGSSRKTLPASN